MVSGLVGIGLGVVFWIVVLVVIDRVDARRHERERRRVNEAWVREMRQMMRDP